MAIFTILSRTVTSPEGPISISHINVCHVVLPDHMTNENHCISITRVVMASKLDGKLPWRAPIHKATWAFDHVVLRDHAANENYYIFTITVLIATKFARMVTYPNRLLTIKSLKALNTWFFKVRWQTRTTKSPPPESLWPKKFAGWYLNLMSSYL